MVFHQVKFLGEFLFHKYARISAMIRIELQRAGVQP